MKRNESRIYVKLPLQDNDNTIFSNEKKDEKHVDELLLIKQEQSTIKKEFSGKFLSSLKELIEKCFLNPKQRKNDFITTEKLILEFLRLLQSQKKFKNSDIELEHASNLCVFDKIENQTGKLVHINFLHQVVEFYPAYTCLEHRPKELIKREFSFIDFFDPYSIKFCSYYEKQRQVHDNLSYEKTFAFLTSKLKIESDIKDIPHYSLGRGIPLDKGLMQRYEERDLRDN